MNREARESRGQAARNVLTVPPEEPGPTVAVPLDGSSQAAVALPVAKGLAELIGATLHVVHVEAAPLPPREVLEKIGLSPEDLRGSVVEQLTGTPAAGIVRAAQEWQSKLLVMCTHTGLPGPEGDLGPVAQEVLLRARAPVVLVPPERGLRPWSLRRTVLPYDGTPTAATAIGIAADLTYRAGAELMVLYVAETRATTPVEPGTFGAPRYVDQPQHEWPSWAHEFVERLLALGHTREAVRLCLYMARGRPAEEIVRFAERCGADLIALAWHGRLGTRRAETVKAVIRSAPCPALVVRAGLKAVPRAV